MSDHNCIHVDRFEKLNDDCNQIKSDIVGIKKDIGYITSYNKDHKMLHDTLAKESRARNWALWLLLITASVSSIAGFLIMALK